jgi:hypothetical protein
MQFRNETAFTDAVIDLTGATAGWEMWGWTRQEEGSLVQGMPAAEQYAHPGNIGAAITFTRDGKALEVSPNDLLAVLSEAADDVFALLAELEHKAGRNP